MVMISLAPAPPRRILAVIALVLVLSVLSCFAGQFFIPVSETPYDQQMQRIATSLNYPVVGPAEGLSLAGVNEWMAQLRDVPYCFSSEWKTPSEIDEAAIADCKGKAIVLYEKLRQHGAGQVRLVIGRRAVASHRTHAWVEWQHRTATYVLDPTLNRTAWPVEHIPNGNYIAIYAYSGAAKYRAIADRALLAKR